MKIVAIADTHGLHENIILPKGDMLIHAGDITLKGQHSETKDFMRWLARQPFTHKILIAGNHDFFLEKAGHEDLKKLLPEGAHYLCDSGITINGIKIWGSPYTPWFHGWAFNRQRGEDIHLHWQKIPDDTQLLITHGPPFGILDSNADEMHVGDKDLLRAVQRVKPLLHLFGHVHEGYGKLAKNGSLFFNACILNERDEVQNKPWLIEI